jgi:hypothetical protein
MIIKNSETKGMGLRSRLTRHLDREEEQDVLHEIFSNKKAELDNIEEEEQERNTLFVDNINTTLRIIDDILKEANKEFNRVDNFGSIFYINPRLVKSDNIYTINMLLEKEGNKETNRDTMWKNRMSFVHDILKDHGIHSELLECTLFYYYHNKLKDSCYEMGNLVIPGEDKDY